MMFKRKPKPEAKAPDLRDEAPSKVPTEAETAAKIARIRTLAESAQWHLRRLKEIRAQIETEGGSIVITADPKIDYISPYTDYNQKRDEIAYTAKANYTAAL